jgi:hypothetical protein
METQKAKVLRARLMDSPEDFRKLDQSRQGRNLGRRTGPASERVHIKSGGLFVSLHLCGD